MAVTEFQRGILRLLSKNRIAMGESYVAGGVALNQLIGSSRVSRDIDLFHDTEEALTASWKSDRKLLVDNGYGIQELRLLPSFVEAIVSRGSESVLTQWTRDSAFRFFPLITDELLGLTLHPFDLATNKVLALVGRLEARDWIDVMQCHDNLQNLGYLFWAACGKDAGFNPASIMAEAKRSSHYSAEEIVRLSFIGAPPDPSALGRHWRTILSEAERIIGILPGEEAGTCVLDDTAHLFTGDAEALQISLRKNAVRFHKGTIKGAYPRFITRGEKS